MEDELILFSNGRRPQFFGKWKTTSKCLQTEDDLNVLANVRQHISWQREDDLDILANGKLHQFCYTGRRP